jgi:hypothetical protein
MVAGPRNRPPHSHAASEKLNSVVRVVQTGPPALFAFPLPLLTHMSWQTEFGRWFKFGLRNHKYAFSRCPISRRPSDFYFPRMLLHKSGQILLSAVIRCRRHSSHLARIRKAGSRRQTESPRTTESKRLPLARIGVQVDYFRVARDSGLTLKRLHCSVALCLRFCYVRPATSASRTQLSR